jgi:hypothetical protein
MFPFGTFQKVRSQVEFFEIESCLLARHNNMTTPQFFGVVIPGRVVVTDFQVVDATKAVTVIESPGSVSDITFFLLPTATIPHGYGAILYYSLPPFQNWILLGSVDPSKPSGVFRTNWSTNEEVRNSPYLQLGVSIEP